MTWTLTIPDEVIPARTLNARGHWSARARHSKQVREAVAWLAKPALARSASPETPVAITCTRWVGDNRARDPDNTAGAWKPCIDGLVDAGVLGGDSWPKYVDSVTYRIRRGEPGWTIEISSLVGADGEAAPTKTTEVS